jgi:Cdc6-like AAA superfamily ATPase
LSSTRYAPEGSPISDERYLSSPKFAELHGISGTAVAARSAIEPSRTQRELFWFLQASRNLKSIAAELKAAFPTRVKRVQKSLRIDPETREASFYDLPAVDYQPLEHFIREFCINPDFSEPRTFEDLPEALLEYKNRCEKAIRDEFFFTDNAQMMWDAMSRALETKTMVLIQGREGRGKTEAAKAFCAAHQGRARFVTLSGITTRTNALREIARALGVASGPGRKASEMQQRVEDVLQKSGLMLVLDEAHWLFDQAQRIYSRPALVDWVGTLCNFTVPIALVATPQFLECMERTAVQVGWNYKQFFRRVKYRVLSEHTSQSQLQALANRLLPGVKSECITAAVNYATLSGKDLSGLGDLSREAKRLAQEKGRKQIAPGDVVEAVNGLLQSDSPFKAMEKRIQEKSKRRRAAPLPAFSSEAARELEKPIAGREIAPPEFSRQTSVELGK